MKNIFEEDVELIIDFTVNLYGTTYFLNGIFSFNPYEKLATVYAQETKYHYNVLCHSEPNENILISKLYAVNWLIKMILSNIRYDLDSLALPREDNFIRDLLKILFETKKINLFRINDDVDIPVFLPQIKEEGDSLFLKEYLIGYTKNVFKSHLVDTIILEDNFLWEITSNTDNEYILKV